MKELNKKDQTLLLYFECRLVDNEGIIDGRRINKEEIDIAREWAKDGFIEFGRLPSEVVFKESNKSFGGAINTHWVRFSDEAWKLAHKYRRERSERMVKKREEKC